MKKSKNPFNESQNLRVLVAPLDWGLGHSTRCIPIIKELELQGCQVYIAADSQSYSLLHKEFPQTVFLRYKGYEIEYSRRQQFFTSKLIVQIPRIFFRVLQEKRWLKNTIKKYGINAIISDNRFGMHNKNIPCVYITHQLYIKTGNQFIERMAQKIHYHFIKKYKVCWVPDLKKNGLAGELSHPKKLLPNIIYIGPLSRFCKIAGAEEIYDLLVIISGPEPQRTIFENEILQQLKTIQERIFLIRGLPDQNNKPENFNNVIIENHLNAMELNEMIERSKVVLCRSGYTSVMDLSALQKKAIFIPTPAQREQEYLSKFLTEKGYFFSMDQKNFSVHKALQLSANYHFNIPEIHANQYKTTVKEFVSFLKSGRDRSVSP